jgi:hypothetical protein
MLVERIVMRTQGGRLPAGETGRIDAGPAWRDEPPRELTGGWPAVRLDEHAGTQQYESVRVDRTAQRTWEATTSGFATPAPPPPYVVPSTPARPAPPRPMVPSSQPLPTSAWPLSQAPAEPPAPTPTAAQPARPAPEPASWTTSAPATETYGMSLPPRGSRHGADTPAEPVEPPPSPLEWLASRSLVDAPGPHDGPATAEPSHSSPRRRRTDDDVPSWAAPDDVLTTERPSAAASSTGYPFGTPAPPPAPPSPHATSHGNGAAGHTRLEEILAESGVQPATGSRRRRRYRDEDGSGDDVLSRVLRGG